VQLPLVAPLAGQDMQTVLRYLTEVRTNMSNMGAGDATAVLSVYQQWASSSSETLGFAFDHEAIEELVLTRRSWLLMATHRLFGEADNGPVIHRTFRAEQTDRVRALDELITKYNAISKRWGESADKFVVPDTNFYLHHDVLFDEADWATIARPMDGQRVRIIVPIAVVRELDRQKVNGKNIKVGKPAEELRTRARRTLRALRDLFDQPDRSSSLGRWVETELMQDPLAHRPVAPVDHEIVERLLVAKRVSGKDFHLLTRDLSMKLTATMEGLAVLDQI